MKPVKNKVNFSLSKIKNILILIKNKLFQFIDYISANHFHKVLYTAVCIIVIMLSLLAFKYYFKVDRQTEDRVEVERVQILGKFEHKYHMPKRYVVLIKCQHEEIFMIESQELYNKLRINEVLYMKYTEKITYTYVNGHIVYKELDDVGYSFSQIRFDEDDGMIKNPKIFSKEEVKII